LVKVALTKLDCSIIDELKFISVILALSKLMALSKAPENCTDDRFAPVKLTIVNLEAERSNPDKSQYEKSNISPSNAKQIHGKRSTMDFVNPGERNSDKF